MKCEFCGQTKSDVEVRRDPFAWDVCNEDWQVPMCDDCEQTRVYEI
ncbi:hypothetical protein ACIGW0_05280 [Streptomyces bikiniensis]|uniref:Small CPxCG-related zinc finger protein n=1 Tax=Streptomyces bikiniensis TaxID=1896 RepID=A0ABW8CMN5_STRBI